MIEIFTLAIAFLIAPGVQSYSRGAPTAQQDVCKTLMPNHRGIAPQSSPAPYTIIMDQNIAVPNGTIRFVLGSPESVNFKGFLVIARRISSDGDTTPQGTFHFHSGPKLSKITDCHNIRNSAATHKSAEEKAEIYLEWRSPPDIEADYQFLATFVEKFDKFWVALPSAPISVRKIFESSRYLREDVESNKSNVPDVYTNCDVSSTQASRLPWCFGLPENCVQSKSCQLFVKYSVTPKNHRHVFQLYGKLSGTNGYVAVGFSQDNQMGSDSVLACHNGKGEVVAAEYYNAGKTSRSVERTEFENVVTRIDGNVVDGWLTCSFAVNPVIDLTKYGEPVFNLLIEQYFIFLSRGPMADNLVDLQYHGQNKGMTPNALRLPHTNTRNHSATLPRPPTGFQPPTPAPRTRVTNVTRDARNTSRDVNEKQETYLQCSTPGSSCTTYPYRCNSSSSCFLIVQIGPASGFNGVLNSGKFQIQVWFFQAQFKLEFSLRLF